MYRGDLLRFLADAILGRRGAGKPLKVAIDGRCGSGKSVLADELGGVLQSRGLQVLRPSVDGFHHPRERRYRQGEYSARGYYEDAFNYEAIVETLLKPLSGSVFPVLCREVSHDIRTELAVDAPAAALSRALARDIGTTGSEDVIRRKYEVRYEPAWEMYCSAEHPERKADIVVVDNGNFLRPAVYTANTNTSGPASRR